MPQLYLFINIYASNTIFTVYTSIVCDIIDLIFHFKVKINKSQLIPHNVIRNNYSLRFTIIYNLLLLDFKEVMIKKI